MAMCMFSLKHCVFGCLWTSENDNMSVSNQIMMGQGRVFRDLKESQAWKES